MPVELSETVLIFIILASVGAGFIVGYVLAMTSAR